MNTKMSLWLLGVLTLFATAAGGQARPVTGGPVNNSGGSPLVDTEWKGTYASGTQSNIPAVLRVFARNGSLMGTLTYDGYEETVAITSTGPRTWRLKGVSYRDVRGGRAFSLDTFTVQLSPDGRSMNGSGGDTASVVSNQWLKLQRADSAATPPQPASENFVRSLMNTSWDGAIAESQKGGTPAQMKIALQKGAPTAVVTYDGFEEVLALSFTAPSGIQMRGTSFRDLSNQRRGFTLDTGQGEVSADGLRLQGALGGHHFDFRRVQPK